MKSRVEYSWNCISCAVNYIGVTICVSPAKLLEHRDALMGVRYKTKANRVIQTGQNIDWFNMLNY